MEGMIRFAERVLGKRVVIARDTPGFTANRLGVHADGRLPHHAGVRDDD